MAFVLGQISIETKGPFMGVITCATPNDGPELKRLEIPLGTVLQTLRGDK